MARPRGDIGIYEGDIFPTKTNGDFEIISVVKSHEIHIRFIETGYELVTRKDTILSGYIKDLLSPSILGRGFIGEGFYKARVGGVKQRSYQVWVNMLRRCYETTGYNYPRYGGLGVTVDPIWYNYQNFAKWFEDQYREGYQLDKDILSLGNKLYHPSLCCMVPSGLNTALINHTKGRGNYPIGVSKRGGYEKYIASIAKHGKKTQKIGSYDTPEEAFQVYKEARKQYITALAKSHFKANTISEEVYNSLLKWNITPYPE